VTSEDHPRY